MMRLRASVQVTGARVDNSFENLQQLLLLLLLLRIYMMSIRLQN